MGKWSGALIRPFREVMKNVNSPVRFYNFWDYVEVRELWFYRFILHRNILEKAGLNRIDFYSVFGPRLLYGRFPAKPDLKIFFTGENVENFPSYRDHMIGRTDLSVGFEYIDHPKYLRFPLWILYIIQPEWGLEEIKAHLEKNFNKRAPEVRKGFCCLVASHDRNGIRLKMMKETEPFGKVDSGGKIYNNTPALKTLYHDRKTTFLNQYMLNICPENSNTPGYVTEKLFQSLECGCIPLYWGSDNRPEPEILNREAILFYDPENPVRFHQKLAAFAKDPKLYMDWCETPKLNPLAANLINDYMNQLETSIIEASRRKNQS